MNITLRPITQSNWEECIALAVTPEQDDFVASNLFSIAQSQFYPSWRSLGVYDDDTMVGYVLIGKRRDTEGIDWIFRMMIGQQYQGRGYGKATLRSIIDMLRAQPDCQAIRLSYDDANIVAERLYRGFGFQPLGRIDEHGNPVDEGGEIVLQLPRTDWP